MRVFLKDLTPGTDYSVQLRTDDGTTVSPWSRKFALTTISDSKRPKKPTNVSWVAHGSAFVGEWDAVTQKEDGTALKNLDYYQVRVTNDPSAGKMYKTTDTRWDFTHDMNMTAFGAPSPTVWFEVRAVDKAGNVSDWTTKISATNGAPDPPVLESVTGVMGALEIKWQRSPSLDVVAYRVYIGDNDSFELDPQSPYMYWEGDATSYTYPTYTFALHHIALVAVDAFGTQSAAAWGSGTPLSPFEVDDEPPEVPTNVAVTEVDATTVNVTWDAGTEDESLAGFYVWYKRAADPDYLAELKTALPESRSLAISGLAQYVDYHFKVKAFDNVGNHSDWSTVVTRTGVPNVAPTYIPDLNVRAAQTALDIRWSHPPIGVDDDVRVGGWYEVEVDTAIDPNSLFPITYQTAATSIAVNGLEESQEYSVRIRAVDAEGLAGPWSDSTNVTTTAFAAPPGAEDLFVPQAVATAPTVIGGVGYFYLQWPAVTKRSDGQDQNSLDKIVYDIHGSTDSAFAASGANRITQVYGTSAVIKQVGGTPVAYDTPYYFRIVARDVDGPAGASPISTAATISKITKPDISAGSIDASMINTGVLQSAIITMGAGGEIISNNWNATNKTGWRLGEQGLTIYNGEVSASLLTAGTISGTTINVGAGGTINIDSTAQIKSNNYSSNSTGWRLSSSGLEVNSGGSISASALKGGTLSAGVIYVASGGGIYDSTGGNYWSITNTGINIYNGTISGASVITNSLRSINTDPNTGQYIFSINSGGYASFAGARIYGSTVVGSSASSSHFIQSYNYSGSTGWRIDGSGNAYFGYGRISAGLFKTSNSRYQAVELGDTGNNDPADELRFFNSYSVSSVRNPSDVPGALRISISGATGSTFTFRSAPSGDGWRSIQAGSIIKFLADGNGFQVRNGGDSNYDPIQASAFDVSSEMKFKRNAERVSVDRGRKKEILKGNGLTKWEAKIDGVEDEDAVYPHNKVRYGIIADDLPDFLRVPDGYSLAAVVGFLWDAVTDLTDRVEALENRGKP